MSTNNFTLVFSYAHADEALRNELEKHLSPLKRMGRISTWHDRRIVPGEEFAGQIDQHFAQADIILLLISSDFIASDYCYQIEMTNALQRHERSEAVVIPVILLLRLASAPLWQAVGRHRRWQTHCAVPQLQRGLRAGG